MMPAKNSPPPLLAPVRNGLSTHHVHMGKRKGEKGEGGRRKAVNKGTKWAAREFPFPRKRKEK